MGGIARGGVKGAPGSLPSPQIHGRRSIDLGSGRPRSPLSVAPGGWNGEAVQSSSRSRWPIPFFGRRRVPSVGGSFFADGKRLAVIGISSGLQLTDLARRKALYRRPAMGWFAVSPDERMMAVIRQAVRVEAKGLVTDPFRQQSPEIIGDTDETIAVMDADTANERLQLTLAQRGVGAGPLARFQDPGRHLRPGSRQNPPVRRRQRQGDPHNQRSAAPSRKLAIPSIRRHPGPDLHTRRQTPGHRHVRRLDLGLGRSIRAMRPEGNRSSTARAAIRPQCVLEEPAAEPEQQHGRGDRQADHRPVEDAHHRVGRHVDDHQDRHEIGEERAQRLGPRARRRSPWDSAPGWRTATTSPSGSGSSPSRPRARSRSA